MKIAVFGTGEVGTAMATRLQSLGHDVVFGSREAGPDKEGVPVLSHADAARHGEWIVNAMHGEHAMKTFPGLPLEGKLLIDQGNWQSAIDGPITETLGESLQRLLPQTRVVKAMNFVSAALMGHPEKLEGKHTVFVAGNDAAARAEVTQLLESIGWQDVLDLGDLSACRAMESMGPLWIRLNSVLDTVLFDIQVVRKPS
ncbi:MAG TPA: NAD(P)-binding domain-containing protein [Devosia sp.]|jgi:predicted dinucleotide-binding enzyme|uniref:NADPH-dependent F420 reductase n=1 Tax=Devosia sp. TaxID=1871048 RepID=UPI002F9346C9